MIEPPEKWPRSNGRPQITEAQVDAAVEHLRTTLKRRLNDEKGWGAFLSRHEILGVVDEEYDELRDAVRGEPLKAVQDELTDIAVGCVFGAACIEADKLHW